MRIEHFSLPTYNIICNYSFMLSLSSHFPWEQGACMVPSSRRNWKHCSIVLVCLSHQGHRYECMVIVFNSLYVFSLYHAPGQLDISCIMTQSIVHISCMSSVYPTMTQRPDRAMEGGPQPHVIRWLPCICACIQNPYGHAYMESHLLINKLAWMSKNSYNNVSSHTAKPIS